MNRSARIILVSIAALLALVIVAIVVLNGTYYGRERVRTLALDALRDMVHGEVIVGRIDGNLLDRFDLVDVQILDEDGQPFLIADRIRARVAFSPLLSRRIIIRSLEIERPIVTVSKTAGDLWNYERIFQGGDTVKGTPSLGWGSWVDLHGITVLNGTLLIHQPYPADDEVRRTVGDSAAFALARESRVKVERVGSSLRQTMEFRDINARIPRLVFAHPDSTAMSFRVRQLSMLATPLEAPDVVVRNMEGDVRITDDTVSLRGVDLSLPESRIKGGLIYHVSAGDVELDLKSDTLAFADIRAIYPKLPDGGGRLDLKATIRDTSTSEYEFTNARLAVGDSRVAGRLGMAVNPSMLELRETDLRFTRFTTELVEALVPGLQVRIPGAFTGRAILSGPSNALTTDVNGTYDPTRHAPFQVTAKGIIGTGDVTSAKSLRLTIRNLPVSLSKEFVAEMPIGGTANIDAVISGSTASQFTGKATITHRETATSTIIAEGSIAPRDQMRMNLGFRLAPLSMEVVERYAPKTDFRGEVRGTGEMHGTLRDLRASVALQLPAGTAIVTGTFDLESASRSYNATTQLHDVDINAIVAKMPVTRLNGEATVVGTGTTVRTMDNRVTVHLLDAMVDSTQVSEAVLVAAARNQRLTVDTLRVRTPFAVATANGTLGLVEGTDGTLTYGIDINTLSGLERWIATGDTTTIPPRNFVRQKTVAQATRTDSLPPQVRGDSAIGAILARKPDEQKPVTLPAVVAPGPLRRDSLAGSATVRGTLKGSLPRFSADGRAALNRLVYNGYEIGKGGLDFTWTDVGTKDATITAEMGVDSVRAAGFAFDSTHVQGTYKARTGDVDLEVFPGDTALYKVHARYALHTDHGEVHLQDINLRLDSVTWKSVRPSTVRWQDGGIAIDSLDLRSGEGTGRGRIFVNGEVPDADPGRLEIRVDSLRVAPWVTLLQSNVPIDGIATLDATIEGTRSDPRMRGTVALREHNYKRVPFPEIHSAFTYDDRRLQFDGELRRNAAAGNAVMAKLKGDVPIDLSLADSVETRKLAGPISIELEGDSIPLSPLADFVEEFSLVTGEARGRVAARGTWDRVRYEGSLAINIPRLGLRTPGVVLTSTVGQLNMVDDRLVIDSLVSHGGGGLTRVTGSVLLADMAHPVVDLKVNADEMRVMDNARGKLVVSSRLSFKGPVDTLDVNGSLIVMHGIVRIPDPEQWNLINTGDPTLFAITDTALTRELELSPPSPILKNASVDVRLEVRRGTWARSREANIEVFGDLAIERFSGDDEISVTGALHSDYGDYELYGRRFQVTSGSVRFTGSANNPVLQLLATHEVRQAGRAPFDIRVTIGGTLERPNISLESQAQPTLTQSDLISFLAFGQSSTSLLQFDGSAVEGGGLAGSSLSGNVASLATRQLASVALGALFTGLEADLSERTAADVLRIRPAELPSGLSLGDFSTVARGTQVEIGKYLDRNTFFVGQFRATFAVPGATLERRFGTQFRVRTSLETRYHPLSPSLTTGLQPKAYQVIAAVLRWTRTW